MTDIYDSIHPPALIQFDGRKSPDSECSSMQSSPRNSPVPKEKVQESNSSLERNSPIEKTPDAAVTPPPDYDTRNQAVDVLGTSYREGDTEEEQEPGRIHSIDLLLKEEDPPMIVSSNRFEQSKKQTPIPLETPIPFDEKHRAEGGGMQLPHTPKYVTPSPPKDEDEFGDLQLVPTDEKMSVRQRSPHLHAENTSHTSLLLKHPQQCDDFDHIPSLSINRKSDSPDENTPFENDRFESPSFTPDTTKPSTSMFKSIADATLFAAQEIENLILGTHTSPDQPTWIAENENARDEIFAGMHSPGAKIHQSWEQDEQHSNWWVDQQNSIVHSPDISMETLPMQQQQQQPVRRTFGPLSTHREEESEDAPADELRRTLSGGPVNEKEDAPEDEICRTLSTSSAPIREPEGPVYRRTGSMPLSSEHSESAAKARTSSLQRSGSMPPSASQSKSIPLATSESYCLSRNNLQTPVLQVGLKRNSADTEEPPRLVIPDFGVKPVDEWRQDWSSPDPRTPAKFDCQTPEQFAPYNTTSSEESPMDEYHHQKSGGDEIVNTSPLNFAFGDRQPLSPSEDEPPSLKESLATTSPIQAYRQQQNAPVTVFSVPEDSKDPTLGDDGSASTEKLIGGLQHLMNDLDTMAQERGIQHKADQSSSFQSCVMPADGDNKQNASPEREQSKDSLVRINALNNDLGIPRGDVLISLLHDDDEKRTWASRVHEAVWRCRTVRRNCDTAWLRGKLSHKQGSPGRGRTSVVVDADDGRVIGKNITELQTAAVEHLKYDELDDSVDIYEEILERYLSHRAELIAQNQLRTSILELEVYIGTAQYNLGIIYMLCGKFDVACDLLEHSSASLSFDSSVDELTVRNKIALCLIAQEKFEEAMKILRETYRLAKVRKGSLPDRRQCAEVLNSIACLTYILHEPQQALNIFSQSLDIQLSLSSDSLYLGSKFSSHSSAMNVAVVRSNVGFLALLARDIPTARVAFESSLKTQALLLRDAHFTLISTMEHLAVVHLFDKSKDKALQLLKRVLHMQMDAFGRNDRRCLVSRNKIRSVEDDVSEGRLEETLCCVPDSTNYSVQLTKSTGKGGRRSFWDFINPMRQVQKSKPEKAPVGST